MQQLQELLDKLEQNLTLEKHEFIMLLQNYNNEELFEKAKNKALELKQKYYGKDIYIRGLIEISSYCKNDCLYCGLRKSNKNAERYRLSSDDILNCAKQGYDLGFRTFVLQGGEDAFYTDSFLCSIIEKIKQDYCDCAITLSLGERSKDSYKKLKQAGADRYLLRHEAIDSDLYSYIHDNKLDIKTRVECLYNLKELGYQVGSGFMVGVPTQTLENLANDLIFLNELKPSMVGIGPFLPHASTPFKNEKTSDVKLVLFLLSLIRIMLPNILIPATTALGTIDPLGREKAVQCGANVVMPNLSPLDVRKKYMLYDNKICTGDEAAECIRCLGRRMSSVGANVVVSRGDCK